MQIAGFVSRAVLLGWLGTAGDDAEVQDGLPALIQGFWEAEGPAAREPWSRRILALNRPVEELVAALHRGPRYREDVPRGRILRQRIGAGGQVHPWLLMVPEDYDPRVPHFLRIELHGGMGCPAWPADGSWAEGWRPNSQQLVLLPAGWWDSMWWTEGQVENFAALLDEVKRTWNVDEDRVLLVGSSDGCIGSCFHALRAPTAYAGFGGSVGCPVRLTNPTLRIDGQMHLCNLAGTRFHVINGGRDRLFPVQDIRDYWDLFRKWGASLEYQEFPERGHGFQLSPEEERPWARFLFGTRRDPLPERLSWATETTERYTRNRWLEILEIGEGRTESPALQADAILPRICSGKYRRLKPPEPRPYGRVDVVREGNELRAATKGVRRFRLLLSPGEFDLQQPIRVVVDGAVVHEGLVEPDAEVLLRWAARDLDRRMLFVAQLDLDVPAAD